MKRCGLGSDSLFTPSLCDPLPGTLCFIYSAFDESYHYILSNFQLLKMVIVSNFCLTHKTFLSSDSAESDAPRAPPPTQINKMK